jgi:Plasmid encoded RepA protein
MILLYLQTQAVHTGSREIALGRSMRDWMERMDYLSVEKRPEAFVNRLLGY